MILSKVEKILQCPCGSKLDISRENLTCNYCNQVFPIKSERIFFSKDYLNFEEWNHPNFKFDLFERVKKTNMPDVVGGPRLKELLKKFNINQSSDFIALNLGGGKDKFEGVYNIDIGNYRNVDFVCSLYKLPFKDRSIDLLISNSVLEHVEYPEKVLDEAKRVIKKKGHFYLSVPSVCLRHHKMDFTRWTMPGLKKLLTDRGFEIINHGACRGPGWVIWHMLESLVVSRTKKGFIREFLRKLVMLITRPLVAMKVRENEKEENMALTIYVIAKKS